MKDLVVVKKGEPVVSSVVVAQCMGKKHRAIMELMEKYQQKFEKKGDGTFQFETEKSGGRPTSFAWLNEENSIFIVSLMRNSEIVVDFKDKLSAAFVRQKKMLSALYSQHENAEWIERRKHGKVMRREETDIIKQFVEYATNQGSQSAKFYYTNITKMENKALFFVAQKYPNLRDLMNVQQLFVIGTADQIVVKAIRDGMAEGLEYKAIYKKAKAEIEKFATIIGKSPLPAVIEHQGLKQLEMF